MKFATIILKCGFQVSFCVLQFTRCLSTRLVNIIMIFFIRFDFNPIHKIRPRAHHWFVKPLILFVIVVLDSPNSKCSTTCIQQYSLLQLIHLGQKNLHHKNTNLTSIWFLYISFSLFSIVYDTYFIPLTGTTSVTIKLLRLQYK